MSNSKKWLVDSSNHGMQSLSAGIEPLLKQLKSIRAQLPKAPKTSKPLLSFKHLNAQNLEGVIEFNLSHKLESKIVNNEKLFSHIHTPFLIFDNKLSYEYTPDNLSSHI